MASSELLIPPSASSIRSTWALLEQDLSELFRSWLIRLWALLTVLFSLVVMLAGGQGGNALAGLAQGLGTFLTFSNIVVIMMGSGALAGETRALADSVLSKPVTRWAYVLSRSFSRALVTMTVALALVAVFLIAMVRSPDGVVALDAYGVGFATTDVVICLIAWGCLAVLLSTFMNSSVVATVVLLVLWGVANRLFNWLGLEFLSPQYIGAHLGETLRGDFSWAEQWQTLGGFGAIIVVASGLAALRFNLKDI